MARDTRTFVRLHNGMPEHPKFLELGGGIAGALAGWLWVCGLCYCDRARTDGVIKRGMLARLADVPDPEASASRLVEAGLWHTHGHTCQTCVQPPNGAFIMHDYLEHQSSRMEITELSAKRAAAGRKGGIASGKTRNAEANPQADAKQVLQGCLNPDTDTDTDLNTSSSAAPTTDDAPPKAPRKRGAKRPAATAVAPRFTEFWSAYPRRKDIGDAERAWTKVVADPTADPQRIIDAARLYAMQRKGQDPQYTKLPATWLNKRSWLDEPDSRQDALPGSEQGAPVKPPWCGECHEERRQINLGRGPQRCPNCHPLTQKASTP
jgi:hypothetical protein